MSDTNPNLVTVQQDLSRGSLPVTLVVTIVIGAVALFGQALVTQYQVGELKERVPAIEKDVKDLVRSMDRIEYRLGTKPGAP